MPMPKSNPAILDSTLSTPLMLAHGRMPNPDEAALSTVTMLPVKVFSTRTAATGLARASEKVESARRERWET
jgi:hypothetical protein